MKKTYLLIAFFSFQFMSAQGQVLQYEGKIYDIQDTDVSPVYPGGTEVFYKILAKNFNPPEEEGINGKVVGTFVIETDGSISNIKFLQDVGFNSKEEMTRVLKKTEKWIPAKMGGVPVRVLYKFSITIRS